MEQLGPLGLCLFGAPADNGNLGVSALGESVVAGLRRAERPTEITVFDHGWGVRADRERGVRLIGVRDSRRIHRPESWARMRIEARLGSRLNPGVSAMRSAAAVLDISGGDSFTDLYGPTRFRAVLAPKLMALRLGVPLVLLPQTYGPFSDDARRRAAARVLAGAARVWSRDAESAESVRALLGADHDPRRHRTGVDVAFALEPREPSPWRCELMERWIGDGPVAGLNISGLIYNDPGASDRFGLRSDYRAAVHEVANHITRDLGLRLVLVPHVFAPDGSVESDVTASRALRAALGPSARVEVVEGPLSAGEAKWLISRLDWFCGTRMHATIAALSSGVPVAAIAYSPKTAGVFATCGQRGAVVDARATSTADVVDAVVGSFDVRDRTRAALGASVPPVVAQAREQLVTIVEEIAGQGAEVR